MDDFDDNSGHAPPRPARVTAPDATWENVRHDYVAGMSGPECCRRYGVGLSALRDRAAREGWRRVDQPWTSPNRLDPDDEGAILEEQTGGDLDYVEMRQLGYIAMRRMMRATMRGDAAEALRWHRVSKVMEQEEAELDRFIAQEKARHHAIHGSRAADAPDDPDLSDGISSAPD